MHLGTIGGFDLAFTVTTLGGFYEEQRQYRRRLEDAERRLVS
ncbi:hypothetical protein [Rhizobium oryzicola]|uniref:Uncharacterized protein n=1 Tax=Rhizobium oryzicola TaxID=1232668 RepID=A0ABT8SWG9_9HYPH|nr:hypothetical protein [Rhizobium oryzicola]MDO1582665.1 hypothetical protein [Rhizobium oryzicola]